MLVGVVKETFPGEKRVALVPAEISRLTRKTWEVVIEAGAGEAAGFPDAQYEAKGAKVLASRADVFKAADVLLFVRALGANPNRGDADITAMHDGQALIGFLDPL